MNLLANKAVSAAYNKLGRVNDLLNGPDPRFVSYRENGKDKKIEHLNLDSTHCHTFISKMKLDGTSTYSEEVIIILLKYFLDHTKKWEKLVIELANRLSELLNGDDSMNWYMNFETQKAHMIQVVKDLDKKRLADVDVVSIEDNNKRLFDVLKNEWLQGLDKNIVLPNLDTSFDSLDIAQYLYQMTKQDPNYFNEIKNLKPEEFRQISWDSDYYGLVEMAIRINALLHGITLQWWVARQKKYDALLLKHINPYVKDFPLLSDFQAACREKLKWESFNWLYFDTQESEKMIGKIQQKDKIKSKARNALLLTLGLGIGIAATNVTNDYIQIQKQKKATQETMKDIFENKKTTRSADVKYWEYTWEMKFNQLNIYSQNVYDRFLFRYWNIGSFTESQFKAKIMDCLNNQKLLNMLGAEWMSRDCVEDCIIDDYLVPQNIGEFKLNQVPVKPYQRFLPYVDEFKNTLLLENNIRIKGDSAYRKWINKRQCSKEFALKQIGDFSIKHSGDKYKFAVAYDEKSNRKYVLSTYVSDPDYRIEDTEFSTDLAKDLTLDLLKQLYPVVNELIDWYLMRYNRRENPHVSNSSGPERSVMDKELQMILLKDILKNNFLHPDWKTVFDNDSNKREKITKYLDTFVIQNESVLKVFHSSINSKLLPNWFLTEYEEAMINTITEKNTTLGDMLRLPVYDFGKYWTIEHIGKYRASDGKLYQVWFLEKDWKKYLYANDITFDEAIWSSRSYWTYEWEIVARDYFATKAKFMEQKILREKQQKSASQKHVDKPRDILKNDWSQWNFKSPYIPFKK